MLHQISWKLSFCDNMEKCNCCTNMTYHAKICWRLLKRNDLHVVKIIIAWTSEFHQRMLCDTNMLFIFIIKSHSNYAFFLIFW